MRFRIHPPQRIQSSITLPVSKSIAIRCAILDYLCDHTVPASQDGLPKDIQVMQNALADLESCAQIIDCGLSGTAMRFLTALLSVTPGTRVLTGSGRLKERPIGPLVDALRALGADITYMDQEGYPPLSISGRQIQGGSVEIPGNISSQFISALMMIGSAMPGGLVIHITTPVHSRPYIDMTIKLMQTYGIQAIWEEDQILSVAYNHQIKKPHRLLEADWSAAAYWYELIALSKDPHAQIVLRNLVLDSLQGDCRTADFFRELGVETEIIPEGLLIKKHNGPLPLCFEKDLIGNPDLAQALLVTCCALKVPFRLSGLSSLTIKETDRAGAMRAECRKLGFALDWDGDTLSWRGECLGTEGSPVIKTYGDHRMALSMAPLSTVFPALMIDDPLVVVKSYPGFFDDLRKTGFLIQNLKD